MQGAARHANTQGVAGEMFSLHFAHPCCPSSKGQPGAVGSRHGGAQGPVPTSSTSWSGPEGEPSTCFWWGRGGDIQREPQASTGTTTWAHSYPGGNRTQGLLAVRQQCKHHVTQEGRKEGRKEGRNRKLLYPATDDLWKGSITLISLRRCIIGTLEPLSVASFWCSRWNRSFSQSKESVSTSLWLADCFWLACGRANHRQVTETYAAAIMKKSPVG